MSTKPSNPLLDAKILTLANKIQNDPNRLRNANMAKARFREQLGRTRQISVRGSTKNS